MKVYWFNVITTGWMGVNFPVKALCNIYALNKPSIQGIHFMKSSNM